MTIFDETKHARDTAGKFTEMAGSEQDDFLTAAEAEAATCARCDAPSTGDDGLCDTHTFRWGQLSIREGSRTPWGSAQHVTDVAAGIVVASTAGHGGLKLSPERNALIPPSLRNSSGWYEEDCEINIPLHYFPDEWCAQDWVKNTPEALREETDKSIKDWFPDKWEKANGRELKPGESYENDRRKWAERHAGEMIVTSAINSESDPGLVRVTARIGGWGAPGEQDEYLVPKDEYEARRTATEPGQDGRFIVDPTRHPKLPREKQPAASEKKVIRIGGDQLSASALSQACIDGLISATVRDRVAKDLGQRWRRQDGTVESMRDILEEQGVSGKTAYAEGSSMKYALLQPTPGGAGHFSLQVSKATFDYFDQIPDDRSPAQQAQQAAQTARERLVRSDHYRGSAEYKKAAARVSALYETAAELREQEAAERVARLGTPEQREAARKAALAERERAAKIGE